MNMFADIWLTASINSFVLHYSWLDFLGIFLANYLPFILVIGIIIFIMIMKAGKARKYASTNHLGFWAAMALMNASSRSHGGSFGSFSSGSGGFGGFGGGSFGGGGAGGSW